MANSSTVDTGDTATAAQYNNLRADAIDTSTGHLHDGSNGRNLDSAVVSTGHLTFNDNQRISLGTGGDSILSYNGTDTIWDLQAVGSGVLKFTGATTVNTSAGNLTLGAAAGSNVLLGDNVTIVYVDGTTGTVGVNVAAASNAHFRVGGSLSTNGAKAILVAPALTQTTTRADAEIVDFTGGAVTVQTGVTITDLQTLRVAEPAITLAGSGAATNAQNILMTTAPTEGGSNFFMRENVNGGNLSTSGVWTDGSSRDIKRGVIPIADLSIFSRLLAMVEVNEYRRENGRQDDPYLRYGMIAEDVPDFLASGNRKGIAAGYVGGFLMGVVQWHEFRLNDIEPRVNGVELAVDEIHKTASTKWTELDKVKADLAAANRKIAALEAR